MQASRVFSDIAYGRPEGSEQRGDLYVPAGTGSKPAVVLIHGGSWASGDKSIMCAAVRRLLRAQFAVFNINYRLAPENPYPAALIDCQGAVRWIKAHASNYNIDPDRIAAWGYSAGGHLAALLGTGTGDHAIEVQAVVAGSAPHDLTLYPHHPTTARFLGTTWERNSEAYRQASPLFNVSSKSAPMFLYHGQWDRIVDRRHTEEMGEALQREKVRHALVRVPCLGHLSLFLLGRRVESQAIEFLREVLEVR